MGKSQGNQKVTTETKLPSWYTDTAKTAMDQALAASKKLSKPYMGNQVAGIDPITGRAINLINQNVGSTNADYDQASAVAAGVAGYNPASFLTGNIDAYMNPYTRNVEQAALGNLDRAYRQNLNTIGDQAINANAFGGSRQGIAEGVAAAENARQMGDLSAQLRSQGFSQAQGMMQSDMDRALQGEQLRLQASGQMGDLASNQQTAYLQGLQQAVAAGQLNQNQAQAMLDQRANQYNAMRQYPSEQLNILLSALGGTQVPTSTTQKTPTSGNFLTGAAGGALAGLPFGPLGVIGGGILGGLSGR